MENKNHTKLRNKKSENNSLELAAYKKLRFQNRVIVIVILAAVISLIVISSNYRGHAVAEKEEFAQTVETQTASQTEKSSETQDAAASSEQKTEKKKKSFKDLSELEEKINSAVANYNGTWSVYVKNLDSNAEISLNNSQMYAASLIKLYALSSAYQQINDGTLNEKDMYSTMNSMIINSSNDCFNSVVWSVGKYYITDWCREHGYNDTVQCHGLYPAANADGLQTYSGYNLTTAEDCGKLLESIYRGECVSKKYSKKMQDILLNQQLRNKIPSGVPENVKVANKTGETEDVCHDAAIVFSDNADYILVVMVDAPGIAYSCNNNVVELSSIVYDYFN